MMFFERIHSDPPESPFAPQWDYSLGHRLVRDIDLDVLSKTCLQKEKEIKKLPLTRQPNGKYTDGYTGLGKNSTTARFSMYNVLEWNTPETNKLKHHIYSGLVEYNNKFGCSLPSPLWIKCWVNILRWGQKIKPHLHSVNPLCYLSGHFTIQAQHTSTCYMVPANQLNDPEITEKENKPGELTLFPSYVPHYTTKHYSFVPRITLAFDVGIKDDSSILIN